MHGGNDADLGSCILQGMVQPVEGAAKRQQLTNERPFWQQRTFSMASCAIVQVSASSVHVVALAAQIQLCDAQRLEPCAAVCIKKKSRST